MNEDAAIAGLREALKVSPENVPLRKHLAGELARRGRWAEAETELREALKRVPREVDLETDLARCFYEQGKNSEALAVVESLINRDPALAEALVLHARLMLRAGQFQLAAGSYRRALESDVRVRDEALASQLGLGAGADAARAGAEPERVPTDLSSQAPEVEVERPKVAFADVGGMDKVKEEIRLKIILPLSHPEIYAAYGKKAGGGILLYGPPGCGKTHIARATAGEVQAGFISVGLHDVLDMWIGSSEKNLHSIFDRARHSRPCVLFFDEADALGASRTDMRTHGGRQVINQFLSELDGLAGNNEGLLVLAATNTPWHLDAAFRRPGRFDRIIFVPPPDEAARAQILEILMRGKPAEALDCAKVARNTEGFSGADLKAVVDLAVEEKLRASLSRGLPTPILSADLLKAAKQVKPSTREWFATARNYALFANEGGTYDEILKYPDRR